MAAKAATHRPAEPKSDKRERREDSRPAVVLEHPREQVTVVRLNRPDRLNALTHDVLLEVQRVVGEISTDPSCRVVVLTGTGRGFCAGLDLEYATMRNRSIKPSITERYRGHRSSPGP